MRLMDRFRQFMIGRYGSDQLNIALLVVYLIMSILLSFTGSIIVLVISYVLMVIIFFRMFSRNIAKRYAENQKFMKLYGPIRNRISRGKTNRRPKTDKNHKIFQCGKCGQMIRVPKGKGKIAITCPSCKQEFIKRT